MSSESFVIICRSKYLFKAAALIQNSSSVKSMEMCTIPSLDIPARGNANPPGLRLQEIEMPCHSKEVKQAIKLEKQSRLPSVKGEEERI